MNIMTDVLYWVSSGLLVPVVVLLLFMLLRSLLLAGSLYGTYAERLRLRKNIDSLLLEIFDPGEGDFIVSLQSVVNAKNNFSAALCRMKDVGWDSLHGEKVISDYEHEAERKMSAARMLVRLGPMLGLMGTLIPMGPALVSLGAGDISSMAVNMQVAFSTTVVGIFTGGIGFMANLFQQRWYAEDLDNLDYILAIMEKEYSEAVCEEVEEVCCNAEKTTF